jgi:hypothetical protein
VVFILGVINSSPLRLEIEFAKNLTENWVVCYTFNNLMRVDYSGSPHKQEVEFIQIK